MSDVPNASVVYDALVIVDLHNGKAYISMDIPYYDDGPAVYDAAFNQVTDDSFLYEAAIKAAGKAMTKWQEPTTQEVTYD